MTEKQFERAIARLDDGHDDPTPMRAGHVIVSRHEAAIEFIRANAPEFRFARIITGNATAADVRGESSSQRIVRYTFSRPQARKLSIREARLLALAVHNEAESLLKNDRLGEARLYVDLTSEVDG